MSILHFLCYLIKVMCTQDIKKTLFRITYMIRYPEDWKYFYKIFKFKQKCKKSRKKFIKFTKLKPTHPVADDTYLARRINKLRSIKLPKYVSIRYLQNIFMSNTPIIAYNDHILDGHGRYTALKQRGFTGWIEIEQYGGDL